jgi:hypothetical protein
MLLLLVAISHPQYFSNEKYLVGFLGFECLLVAVSLYKSLFFPVCIFSFLMAGIDLPISSTWLIARWIVLGVGAVAGTLLVLRERRHPFGAFHAFALFALLAAMVSAAESLYKAQSSMKVVSLFLLFLYAGTGMRVSIQGRENRFLAGLVTGCEIFVGVIAAFYLSGMEILGNPNSLGAAMGVAAAPILLWGALLKQGTFSRRRRSIFFGIAMCLTFFSEARAAMLASVVSCGLLCLVLRKFRLLTFGMGIIAIFGASMAILKPEAFSDIVSVSTSTVLYKGKDPSDGIMASRQSPWRDTVNSIQKNWWFGTGFGTSDNGDVESGQRGRFVSTTAISKEHGSSYLAILSWVGVAGVLPFMFLLISVFRKITQTMIWILRTGEVAHPVIPLAVMALAGLIHAAFEDWLFAPGYYLCVFFWCMVFAMVDQFPSLVAPDRRWTFLVRSKTMRPDLRTAVPNR